MPVDTIHDCIAGGCDGLWTWDEAAGPVEDEAGDERDTTMFAPQSLFSLPIDHDVELCPSVPSPTAKADSNKPRVESGEWSLEVYPISSVTRPVT